MTWVLKLIHRDEDTAISHGGEVQISDYRLGLESTTSRELILEEALHELYYGILNKLEAPT